MHNELVSILMPSFNSAPFIAAAIASVQVQTHTNWELIIIDDASSDETVTIVKALAQNDSRIHCIALPKNQGTGVARNTGLQVAKGRYIAFLDADDLWKPHKLDTQIAFMEKQQLAVTYSFYDIIDEVGLPLNKTITAPLVLRYQHLFFCNFVGNLTGVYDRSILGTVPIPTARKRQDWMHWLSILQKTKTAHVVPESLAYYRVRNNSISASKLELIKHNFAVYTQFHGYNFIKASFCMIGFLAVQLLIKPRFKKQLQQRTKLF